MYTVEDNKNMENYDDYEENNNGSFWNQNKGIIIKVIIIILCIIALILLISALKKSNNNVVYDENTHNANIEKVRLAAEKYFFINGNMPKENETKKVTVQTLISNGLTSDVVDYNQKVCNGTTSNITLKEDNNIYTMRINLSCSTNEKEEVFFYNKGNYACLNCNGKTNMDGKTNNNEDPKKEEPKENYSCSTWSTWTSDRINDMSLIERTRTLVKGVKIGGIKENIVYGEWSEYSETPVEANDNLEVEQMIKKELRWSDALTTTDKVEESDTLKILSVNHVGGSSYSYCPSGYTKDGNKCYSEEVKTGDLSYTQYNTYKVYNRPCNDTVIEKNSSGKYETVYKGCKYSPVTGVKKSGGSSYTTYTYQILEEKDITYYRSRTKTITHVQEENVYTDNYYEEANLPVGYQKVVGSEKIEYSYKYPTCEK